MMHTAWTQLCHAPMQRRKDLTLVEGHVVLLEYMEERPLLLSRPGADTRAKDWRCFSSCRIQCVPRKRLAIVCTAHAGYTYTPGCGKACTIDHGAGMKNDMIKLACSAAEQLSSMS